MPEVFPDLHLESETERKLSLYERLCKISEGIIKVEPDKKTKEKIEEAIKITKMRITPEGAASLAVLFMLFVLIISLVDVFLYFILGIGLSLAYVMFFAFAGILLSYYLYNYPIYYKRVFLTRVGSELPFLIMYMVIYLRQYPTMEGALQFASKNLSGEIVDDIRKILWDLEVGKYRTVDEALISYLSIWGKENKYMIDAIRLLNESINQPEERRLKMLDEAIRVTFDGVSETAKRYSQELKIPIMLIHALGILLPVIGLVMFPILAIFLNISSFALFFGYDVLLPASLLFFIHHVLGRRPSVFTRVRPVNVPGLPPYGKLYLNFGKRRYILPILPISLAVSVPIIILGVMATLNAGKNNLLPSFLISFGILLGTSLYFYLSSRSRLKLREEIRNMEEEFSQVLYQIGNSIYNGIPLETAIERSVKEIGDLKIKNFFSIMLRNIRRLGMSFKQSIFDPTYGAIVFYPSYLIESVMKTVADASRKSIYSAAKIMISISKYLKILRKLEERIKELLEDVVSSLKLQAYALTPIVSGIIVTLSTVVINIINKLTSSLSLSLDLEDK